MLGPVTVVHVTPVLQPWLGSAQPGELQDSEVLAWHAIPDAQSASVVQGPGSQSRCPVASHTGGAAVEASHASPGAHAVGAVAEAQLSLMVWQLKPLVQSPSEVQGVSARAGTDAAMAPKAMKAATEGRMAERAARRDRAKVKASPGTRGKPATGQSAPGGRVDAG